MDALFANLAGLKGAEKGALAPIVQERIAQRGIVLDSKPIEADLVAPNSSDHKTEKTIGELLKGAGALVRTIRLRHVQ